LNLAKMPEYGAASLKMSAVHLSVALLVIEHVLSITEIANGNS
jgi:hypothetical protein